MVRTLPQRHRSSPSEQGVPSVTRGSDRDREILYRCSLRAIPIPVTAEEIIEEREGPGLPGRVAGGRVAAHDGQRNHGPTSHRLQDRRVHGLHLQSRNPRTVRLLSQGRIGDGENVSDTGGPPAARLKAGPVSQKFVAHATGQLRPWRPVCCGPLASPVSAAPRAVG